SAAGRAKEQDVGAVSEPDVTGGEGHDLGFGEHRRSLEVEGGERLAGGQPGLRHVAFDAPAGAVCRLMLGPWGEGAGGGPALLVGLSCQSGPDALNAGQAQLGEQQLDAGRVDGRRNGAHAAPPTVWTAASSS